MFGKEIKSFDELRVKKIPKKRNLEKNVPSRIEENEVSLTLNPPKATSEVGVEYKFDERLGKIVPINKPTISQIQEKSGKSSISLQQTLLKVPEIDIEPQVERVSKYLSRSSITSRRGAKKMLETGVV